MIDPAPIPARLLVVDDNEANRDMLSRRLERRGYLVALAEDGLAALYAIEREAFDLVLLDVNMPGIDGFETLRRVRSTSSATELPIIMVTARDQREDIVQALESGANDYVTKPLDFPVVMARVQTQLSLKRSVDTIRQLERDLARRNGELEAANQRMSRDLQAAAKLQQALLPSQPLVASHVLTSHRYLPCDELAGDILNAFAVNDSEVAFYLLDVSGHGVPAALLSVTLSRLLSPIARQSSLVRSWRDGEYLAQPPRDVVHALNRRFQLDGGSDQYFTICYGVLNVATRQLRYVSAGHPGPLLASAAGEVRDLTGSSFPVGWLPDATYDEQCLTLAPGDRLFVYSDGIPEAKDAQRRLFGTARLSDALRAAAGLPLNASVDALIDAATAWAGGEAAFDDDVCVLGLEPQTPA